MASTLMSVLAAVEKLVEGQQILTEGQQRLAESQAAGFKEVNERLDRVERTLNATFEQVGKTAEDVTLLKSDVSGVSERLDAQRNLIAKANESIEMLKIKVQN